MSESATCQSRKHARAGNMSEQATCQTNLELIDSQVRVVVQPSQSCYAAKSELLRSQVRVVMQPS